ncbi:MAG: methionyl-tRNA formyltransferase [Gammaproteobacteria bacterium]
MSAIRIGFAGTPEFAATILTHLIDADWAPAVVYTQPDRPAGRGRHPTPSPVKRLALQHALPLEQPASLKSQEAQENLGQYRLDLLIVAAYGLILPQMILSTPRLGCINVHASLLPRWRGAAPIERALMAGDRETGVCIMQMDAGLDTGPVLAERTLQIAPDATGPTLEHALAAAGGPLLIDTLATIDHWSPQPQPAEGITYAHKLGPRDSLIDWHLDAITISRQVRALTGRQPAYTWADLGAEPVQLFILAARADESTGHESTGHESTGTEAPGTIMASPTRGGLRVACGRGHLIVDRVRLNRGKGTPMLAVDARNGFPAVFVSGNVLRSA